MIEEKTEEKKRITERLNDLEAQAKKVSVSKGKVFKFRWWQRMQQKRIARKNKLLVFMPTKNMSMDAKIFPIVDGMLRMNELNYPLPASSIFLWKGRVPAMIQPEWSTLPVCATDFNDKKIDDLILLRTLQQKEAQDTKKGGLGGSLKYILIIAGVALVGYIIYQQLAK